jgi:hypothetical protein
MIMLLLVPWLEPAETWIIAEVKQAHDAGT